METPPELIAKARPFFLKYFSDLAKDMNTLTAAPVSCSLGEISILQGKGQLEAMLEADRSLAYVVEDGLSSGDVHLFLDVTIAIALTGHMMMMGESLIQDQVKNRQYTEEISEGFQEIANQVIGAMNTVVERKLKGGHLRLITTQHVEYGDYPKTLQEATRYLKAQVEIRVSNFPAQPAYWLLSKGFAEALLEIKFPDGSGAQAGGQAAVGEGGQVITPGKPGAKLTPQGVDLTQYANLGVDARALLGGRPDLDSYAGMGTDTDGLDLPPDLAAFANRGVAVGDEGGPRPVNLDAYGHDAKDVVYIEDGLPDPNEPGGVKALMTEVPFSLKDTEKVIRAINAMRLEGHRYIGVDDAKSKLVRVITRSDLRQLMGPFFGTKAMNARDKAICTVELGKINKDQRLVRISLEEGTINQAADLITEFELKALPVVSAKGVLRGFIPVHQILKYFRKKRSRYVGSGSKE